MLWFTGLALATVFFSPVKMDPIPTIGGEGIPKSQQMQKITPTMEPWLNQVLLSPFVQNSRRRIIHIHVPRQTIRRLHRHELRHRLRDQQRFAPTMTSSVPTYHVVGQDGKILEISDLIIYRLEGDDVNMKNKNIQADEEEEKSENDENAEEEEAALDKTNHDETDEAEEVANEDTDDMTSDTSDADSELSFRTEDDEMEEYAKKPAKKPANAKRKPAPKKPFARRPAKKPTKPVWRPNTPVRRKPAPKKPTKPVRKPAPKPKPRPVRIPSKPVRSRGPVHQKPMLRPHQPQDEFGDMDVIHDSGAEEKHFSSDMDSIFEGRFENDSENDDTKQFDLDSGYEDNDDHHYSSMHYGDREGKSLNMRTVPALGISKSSVQAAVPATVMMSPATVQMYYGRVLPTVPLKSQFFGPADQQFKIALHSGSH